MQDVRIDEKGNFRCWKCGGRNFDEKRTFRSKATLGVGALLTHKKLKCLACGEYNDTGSAKQFVAPPKPLAERVVEMPMPHPAAAKEAGKKWMESPEGIAMLAESEARGYAKFPAGKKSRRRR